MSEERTAEVRLAPVPQESVAARVRKLTWQARGLARQDTTTFLGEVDALRLRALEIAEGGDAYLNGIRDIARQLADDLQSRSQTMDGILAKAKP